MSKPRVLILHATGTNRDREAAWACELAGGDPEIVPVNQIVAGERHLRDYQMLVLPGGFSYGDALGGGRLWAVDLQYRLRGEVYAFICSGKPVLGICNGFQALVKAGWLPGPPLSAPDAERSAERQAVTLTHNASARFECRWVWLQPQAESRCIFTQGLEEPICCPVAHGEGRFVPRDNEVITQMDKLGLIALRYITPEGRNGREEIPYPWNPNGSVGNVAGICNPEGNVLGLMPHPEDHIVLWQHPGWTRGKTGNLGLVLFQNGIRYVE